MPEWIGTVLFLAAVGLTGYKLEEVMQPWPKWTVIPTFLGYQLLILTYAGGVAVAFT